MRRAIFLCASVGAVALATTPALAQSNLSAPPPTTDGTGDIIVTATKQVTTVQHTPLSIGVITGDEIARRAQNSVEDVLRNLPAVQIQDFAQGAQVYIRGIGSSVDPLFADPSIALMNDGVYDGRTESLQAGGFDIDRVEVARGPQGTLYGRNATGGVINVLTRNPLLGTTSGDLRLQIGNYNSRRVEGAINLPLGQIAAVRVAAFREKRDGYIDDGSDDANRLGFRVKVLVAPTPWLRVIGKAEYSQDKGAGPNTVPVPGSGDYAAGSPFNNLGIFPPPFLTTNFNPPLAAATNPPVCPGSPFVGCAPIAKFPNGWVTADNSNPWTNDPDHAPGFINRHSYNYLLNVEADLGPATLTLLPSYTRNKNAMLSNFLFGDLQGALGAPTPNGPNGYASGTSTYKSVEARLSSKGAGPFKYVLGVYYLDSKTTGLLAPASSSTDAGNTYTLGNQPGPSRTIAAFGQVTYSLTDAFRLTGGLRWSRDKQEQFYLCTITLGGVLQNCDASLATAVGSNTSFRNAVSIVQYKVGFEYDLTPKSLLYGHVASGFKQGGVNYTAPPLPFKPEHLTAFEVGSKNRFLDNHLTLNLAGFYYKYRDYQYSAPLDGPLGTSGETASIFGVILNAGSTNIYGAEAELLASPWKGGRFTATLNWLHARYGQACLGSNPFVGDNSTDVGCTAAQPHSLTGKQIQNAPNWSGTVGFEQSLYVGPGSVIAGVDTRWSSSLFVSPEQYLPGAFQKAYTVTSARLRYETRGGRWSVGAWVNNIENKAQTTGVFPLYRRFVSAPRTYGLTTEVKF